MSQVRDEIRREAARLEEDTLYTAKGHFQAARIWGTVHLVLGAASAVLAAAAGTSVLAEAGDRVVVGLLALGSTGLTSVLTFLKPGEKQQAHLGAGNGYLAIKNEARMLRNLEHLLVPADDALYARLTELNTRRNELNQASLQIPRLAFRWARRGIEAGEADYQADSELTRRNAE